MNNISQNACGCGSDLSVKNFVPSWFRGPFSAIIVLVGTGFVSAAPIVDTFENTSMLSSTAGSSLFDISTGDLVVTPAETSPGVWGAYNGQAIFIWSLDGGKFAGFSLDSSEDQFVLQMTGVQNVTPVGKNDAFMYGFVYLFSIGGEPVTSYFDVNPVSGSFSLNVYDVALATLGSVPNGLKWTVEFYVASGGQEGVGYQIESIAAVPEPGTFALLFAGCCIFVGRCIYRKNRNPRSLA